MGIQVSNDIVIEYFIEKYNVYDNANQPKTRKEIQCIDKIADSIYWISVALALGCSTVRCSTASPAIT